MIRTLCALGIAATPVLADPLPEGAFMLGSPIWSPDLFSHYVTLHIDGDDLRIELSHPVMTNDRLCSDHGECTYVVDIATAQIAGDGASLSLANIDVFTDLPPSVWAARVSTIDYADPLVNLLEGAAVEDTDFGFRVTSERGVLEFYQTDAATRQTIRAYPIALSVSIADLTGCEVRGLVPLLTAEDLTPAEEAFRQALLGFDLQWQTIAAQRALSPLMSDPDPEDEDEISALIVRNLVPSILARAPEGTEPVEQTWADFGEGMFQGDRASFDANLASYGDTLLPLAAFLRHMRNVDGPVTSSAACRDLSFGFITAQGG